MNRNEVITMVYVKGADFGQVKPRSTVTGKLVSISTDPKAVENKEEGKYKYLDLAVVHEEKRKDPVWYNIRVSKVNLSELPELKKADELVAQKIKPLVQVRYYESTKIAKDEQGNEIINPDGSAKVYRNKRASAQDIKDGFKVLSEDSDSTDKSMNEIEID